MKILPKIIQKDEYRFIRLRKWRFVGDKLCKAPIPGIEWSKSLHKFDDPILLKHIKDDGNVGWVAGHGGVRFPDIDSEGVAAKIFEPLAKKLNTLILRTGGGGYHLPVITKYDKNHIFKGRVGEYRAKGQYIMIVPSKHPNGKLYSVFMEKEVAVIDAKKMQKILKPLIRGSLKTGKQVKIAFKGAVKAIPDSIDKMIRDGNKGTENRNQQAWIIAKELFKRGFDADVIRENILKYNENCTPSKTAYEVNRHITYILARTEDYFSDMVDEEWLKKQNYGATPLAEKYKTTKITDLMNREFAPIDFWMPPIIPKNCLILIGGSPGSYKSLFSLSAALSMVRERIFLNKFITTDRPKVLLYDLENNERLIHWRIKYLMKGDPGTEDLEDFEYRMNFDKANMHKEFDLAMKYDIIILDSFRRFLEGDTNTSETVNTFFQIYLKPLIDVGKTVMMLHHLKKHKRGEELSEHDILQLVRGSSDIAGIVDFALVLFRSNEVKDGNKLSFGVQVYKAKNRIGAAFYPFEFKVTKNDEDEATTQEYLGECHFITPQERRRVMIKKLIGEGKTTKKEILRHFKNTPVRTITLDLTELVERGDIKRTEHGSYELDYEGGDYEN